MASIGYPRPDRERIGDGPMSMAARTSMPTPWREGSTRIQYSVPVVGVFCSPQGGKVLPSPNVDEKTEGLELTECQPQQIDY